MTNGYIYFITDGTYTKIGRTSKCPQKRLRTLQTGHPNRLRIVHILSCEGSVSQLEKRIHQMFWAHRVHRMKGEWFNLSQEHLDWIITWLSEDDINAI